MNNGKVYLIVKKTESLSGNTENILSFIDEKNAVRYLKSLKKKWLTSSFIDEILDDTDTSFKIALQNGSFKVTLITSVLEDYVIPELPSENNTDHLISITFDEVCSAFEVRESLVLSESRVEEHKLARFAISSILLSQTVPIALVARTMRKDRTTIIHHRLRAKDELFTNRYFKNKMITIVNNIKIRLDELGLDFKYIIE